MSRTAIRYVKWKIFFDGVEVPWIDFGVQTGVDSPGEATISLPPDPMLIHQRARTKVHIFMFDEFEEGVTEQTEDSDKKAYKLYWEGEITDISDSETPTSRQFVVSAKGIMDGLTRSHAYMLGLGAIGASPLITGSSLLKNDSVASRTLLALSDLADQFDVKETRATFNSDSYAERALRLIAFLASHNAWLRLHVSRTGLIGKIAGIGDRTLTHLIPRILASAYFKQVGDNANEQDGSALDILARFNGAVFHHFSGTTLPKFVDVPDPKGKEARVPSLGDIDNDRYTLIKRVRRNDYFILPETYYAIPPMCNLIFPEMNTSFSVRRSFNIEPTRSVVVDTQLGTNVVVVAPDDLFRYDKKPGKDMRPEEVWGVNWNRAAGDAAKSPYISPSGTNLFTAITDLEIERGINPLMSVPPFQVFSALVNGFDLARNPAQASAQLSAAVKDYGTMFLDLKEDDAADKTGQRYVYMLKALADYNLTLTRYTRQATISMLGHRWLVPGFPAVILRKNGSYIAYVKAHRFSVDANGQETSAVDLDYVRPLPVVDYAGAVSNLRDMDAAVLAVRAAFQGVHKAYDALAKELGDAYEVVLSAYRAVSNADIGLGALVSRETDALANSRQAYSGRFSSIINAIDPEELGALMPFSGRPDDLKTLYSSGLNVISQIKKSVSIDDMDTTSRLPTLDDVRISRAISVLKDAVSSCGVVVARSTPLRQYFAFPPLFANEDMVKKETAEVVYAQLLGTRTDAYTRYDAGGALPVTESLGGGSSNIEIAHQNQKAYTEFLSYMSVLSKIFPIGVEQGTEWSERAERIDALESVRDWEERDILRRTGSQSLASFAAVHKLDVGWEPSALPSGGRFCTLRPLPENYVQIKNSANKELWWDNTLFSCIVDEKKFAGEGSDPEILKLRESVVDEALTTRVRQEYWIAYSSKHWGSGAHDLS